ncbi:MAG: THUMP domain-containing protein [Candidatus Heimdallarchaeaceae archaeon]
MKQNNIRSNGQLNELVPSILIRFSEIGIKSAKTRKWLTRKLISHMEFVLKNNGIEDFQIENRFSRIFIFSEETDKIVHLLSNFIPGIANISKVYDCKTDFQEITDLIRESFFEKLRNHSTFAIKVKRTGKHPFSSVEIAADIGEFILDNLEEKKLRVNLTDPEYYLYLEIREGMTYVYDQVSKGLGGLPAGCQGKVLVIISGEDEDIANILQLYKRGAITLIYSISQFSQYSKGYQEAISKLLALQQNLKKIERVIFSNVKQFHVEEALNHYQKSQCLSIAMSKAIFEELSMKIPTTIPIFVPHLVENPKEKEISIFYN